LPPPEPAGTVRRTLLVVSVAGAMTTMDITIVNVALAAIGIFSALVTVPVPAAAVATPERSGAGHD